MPEDKNMPLVEVWIWTGMVRHRVFRGRNPKHIEWKLNHHQHARPELITINEPPAPPKPGPRPEDIPPELTPA
jgi:hypothetical protein